MSEQRDGQTDNELYQVKVDVGLLNREELLRIIELTFRALALCQSKREGQTDNG